MDENSTVAAAPAANTAPAAPAPASPAPAAPAVPQVDAVEENVVSLGELMGDKKADAKGSGIPKPGDKTPAEPDKPAEPAPAPYKSQRDVDVAIGKRLEAERKKWEKQNAPTLRALETLRDMNPGMTDVQILEKLESDRDEALGMSPGLSAALKRRGLLSTADSETESDSGIPDTDEARNAVVDKLAAQADEIAKIDPDFNLEKFAEKYADQMPAILKGEGSLTSLFFAYEGPAIFQKVKDQAFKEGQAAAVKDIRDRNDHVPAPVSPSAPAGVTRDFSKMDKATWEAHQKEIKAALNRGEHVRLT